MNCHPIRTQRTSPSSQTRLVDANWNASAVTADAPFWNNDFAIAIAAYEHEEEAAPNPVARATGFGPDRESAASIRARGTHAWTIADTLSCAQVMLSGRPLSSTSTTGFLVAIIASINFI